MDELASHSNLGQMRDPGFRSLSPEVSSTLMLREPNGEVVLC